VQSADFLRNGSLVSGVTLSEPERKLKLFQSIVEERE
jgi:hypothetical protein